MDNAIINGDITNNGSIIGSVNLTSSTMNGDIINGEDALIQSDGGDGINISTLNGSIHNSGTITTNGYGVSIVHNGIVTGDIINSADALISGTFSAIGLWGYSTLGGSISNSGSIIATSTHGMYIAGESLIEGGINNLSGGLISGNEVGISILTGSSVSGGITNSGTIDGHYSAINISNESFLDGGITNNSIGLITAVDTGISIESNSSLSGGITNNGSIIASKGVSIENGVLSGGITNNAGGLIQGDYTAIKANESTINGNITNNGSIIGSIYFNLSTMNGDIINSTDALIQGAGGYGVQIATLNGSISNSGTITSDEYGVNITYGGIIDGDITNSAGGLIEGTFSAVGLWGNSTLTGSISNSGSIIATSTHGMYIADESLIEGGINNLSGGLISGNEVGISILTGSSVSGGITNSGTISGGDYAILLSNLNDELNITISGNNAHVIGDVVDEEYENGNSIVLIDGNFKTEGNWQVSDLTVASGKTLTISAGDDITLDHMSASDGTFLFEVGGTGSGEYGELTVTDGNINLEGANVAVHVTSDAEIADGDEIKIGSGVGAVSGITEGKTAITDDSFLYDFTIGDGSNVTDGSNDYLFIFVSDSTFDYVNQGAARAIADLRDSDDEIVQDAIVNIGAASGADRERVLESLNPTSDGSSFVASANISDSVSDLTGTRLASLRDGNPSSGIATGGLTKNNNVWGQALGKTASQDERNNVSGYDADTAGVAFGADTGMLDDRLNAGIALGMAKTDVTSKSLNATITDVDSYQISFYSDYRINDNIFVEGNVGYIFGDNNSTRNNVGGTGAYATGDYNSQQVSARAKLGRDYRLGDTKVTLSTLAHYVNYNQDGYTETGNAGALLLTVGSQQLQKFELGIGADFSKDINLDNGYVLRPSVNIGYRHDFLDDDFASTATFTGGGTFTTNGLNPADDTLDLGAGLKLLSSETWDVSVDYGYEYQQDYSSHTGTLKVGYKF